MMFVVSLRGAFPRSGARLLSLALLAGAPAAEAAAQTSPAAAQVVFQGVGGYVRGVVLDSASGVAVPAARVRVLEVHREYLTHDDGAFLFGPLAPGRYSVSVQRLGYRMQTRTVAVDSGGGVELRIALAPSAVQLTTTVVTGTLDERSPDEVLSPTSVLSGADLDRRMEGTVGATLQSQPGVSVSSIGPATARPVIRGMGSDRILILEDGLRSGDLSSLSADHGVAIEPLTARQMEVVRGPMSLLYGSSALGGVVNVVRDEVPRSLPEHMHGMLSVQGASANRSSGIGGFATAAAGRHVALRGEASARTSGDLHTPAGTLVNTDARTYNFAGGGSVVGSRGYVGSSYRFYDNAYGIPGGFVGGHPTGVDIETRRHAIRLEGDLHPDAGFTSLRGNLSYTDYRLVERERSGRIGTSFDQALAAAEAVARHRAIGPFALGAVGARAQYRDVATGGSLNTPPTYDYTVAGFLVEEVALARRARLQAGVRYDVARFVPRDTTAVILVGDERIPVRPRTFGSASGSLGVLLTVREGVRVGTSVSRAYRTPDFNELYSNGPHLAAESYDVGDPSLDEETGLGVDAFLRVDRNRLRLEVAAFRNQLDGYIFPQNRGRNATGPQGGRPLFQYTGVDARFTGAEGQVEWSFSPRIVLEGTVSYVRARRTDTPDSIPEIPGEPGQPAQPARAGSYNLPLIPPLNGRVDLRYEKPPFFSSVGARATARQDQLGDFEQPTAGYGVLNAMAGVRFLAGRRFHTITLRTDNIADKEYREHLSRVKAIMPEAGRNVSLLYRLTF